MGNKRNNSKQNEKKNIYQKEKRNTEFFLAATSTAFFFKSSLNKGLQQFLKVEFRKYVLAKQN